MNNVLKSRPRTPASAQSKRTHHGSTPEAAGGVLRVGVVCTSLVTCEDYSVGSRRHRDAARRGETQHSVRFTTGTGTSDLGEDCCFYLG